MALAAMRRFRRRCTALKEGTLKGLLGPKLPQLLAPASGTTSGPHFWPSFRALGCPLYAKRSLKKMVMALTAMSGTRKYCTAWSIPIACAFNGWTAPVESSWKLHPLGPRKRSSLSTASPLTTMRAAWKRDHMNGMATGSGLGFPSLPRLDALPLPPSFPAFPPFLSSSLLPPCCPLLAADLSLPFRSLYPLSLLPAMGPPRGFRVPTLRPVLLLTL